MKNRTRKRAVFRTMLLAAVGIGAVGVVQRSIEPKADAESLSLGTISAQMRDHQGTEGSNEANCIRYAPSGSATSSDIVTSPDEALAAHGWTESCPGSLDLDQQSAVGITPVASGDLTNGESFLLAEVTHYNRRVEGNGAEFYDGVARLRFGDFDGDPSIDLSWELWETTNTSGMGQGQCPIRGPQGGEAPCVDRVVFTIPDEVAMTKDGRSYRLTIDEVTAVEGEESCPAVPGVEVTVSEHEEDEHEEEGNTILTAEGMERRGCVYGTVMQGSVVTIVKAIEGVDTDVVAPSTMFVIDSSATPTGSSWNGISFELTPPDDGSASTDPKIWSSGEMVTLTEQDPMNPRWELTDITCTGADDYEFDLETRTLVLGNQMMTVNDVQDGPITCTFTNTYTPKTTLTLVKVVADGEAEVDDFTLSATGIADTPTEGEVVSGVSGTSDTTQVLLPAGDYVLAEDGPEGYLAPDGWDCGDAEMDGATVTLADEADVTCTIVNEIEREEITLTKDPSRDFFSAAGQVITYSYTITNTGNQPLGPGQFEVTDDMIDAGVAFDCGADDVALDPDETVTCTRDYTSTAADVTAGEIVNEAFASLGDLDSENVTATVEYAVLLIAKSPSPTQVSAAGQTVTYTYTLTNNGTDPLGPDQFTVTDDKIDSGTAFNCGAAASTIAVAGTLSCTSTYTVTAADITAGSIVNTASAAGAGVVSPTVSATVTVTTPVLPAATPSLNLTKTASPDVFVAVGDVITYTYTILNDGDTAIGPTQFTITDNKINGGVPFNCGPATKVISVDLSQVCTAYYTITAADVAAGSVTNTAFATGGTVDSNTATATVNLVSLIFPSEIPVTGAMSTTVLGFGFVTFGLGLGFVLLVRRRRLL